MEAGRELDALVSEKVMGWTRGGYDNMQWVGNGANGQFLTEYGSAECDPFSPSTDIAAAWQILEKLRELGFNYISVVSLSNGWQCWGDKAMTLASVPPDVSVNAETAPLAICLAALQAVGVEVT